MLLAPVSYGMSTAACRSGETTWAADNFLIMMRTKKYLLLDVLVSGLSSVVSIIYLGFHIRSNLGEGTVTSRR